MQFSLNAISLFFKDLLGKCANAIFIFQKFHLVDFFYFLLLLLHVCVWLKCSNFFFGATIKNLRRRTESMQRKSSKLLMGLNGLFHVFDHNGSMQSGSSKAEENEWKLPLIWSSMALVPSSVPRSWCPGSKRYEWKMTEQCRAC